MIKDPFEHNYMKEQLQLLELGVLKKGEVYLVDVAHDRWCDLYSGKGERCNCDPEIIDRRTGRVLNRKEGSHGN